MSARPSLPGFRLPTGPRRAIAVLAAGLVCVLWAVPDTASAAIARSALAARPQTGPTSARSAATAVRLPPGRYNVSQTHSPAVLRMLAGRPGTNRAAVRQPAGAVQGVDVASFQHPGGQPIDWGQVAAGGYRFAFIKATEGTYYVNPYYATDLAAARAAGLFVAGYHFAIPNISSGTLQADFALNAENYPANGQTLPFILDAEYDPYTQYDHTNQCYGLTQAQMVSWISAFTAEIRRRTGQPTIIYTPAKWWDTCTGGSSAFGSDPLWVASPTTTPTLPSGWPKWTFWQYTSTGTVAGIPGNTDLSYFNPAMLTAAQLGVQSNAKGASVGTTVRSLAGRSVAYSATGLPHGLTISSSGVISGRLRATTGRYRAAVTLRAASASVTLPVTWYVHGAVRLEWPGRQSTPAGGPANLQIRSSDGLRGCTLNFTATGLPPGLSLSPCGQITGWATRPGQYMVHLHATDSSDRTVGAVSFSWTVTVPAPGSSGLIRLGPGKLCLTSRTGVTVSVQTCSHSGGQIWDYVQNGTIRLNGRCLTAQNGAPVGFGVCNRSPAQSWTYVSGGSLVNGGNGLCLADKSSGGQPGEPVVLTTCASSASQTWTLPAGPIFAGLPGQCLAAVRPGSGSLLRLVLTRCARVSGQSWTLTPDGTLQALGQCLTAQTPLRRGGPVILSPCAPPGSQRARQLWQVLTENGSPFLVSPVPGLCLGSLLHGTVRSMVGLRHCTIGYPRVGWSIS